MIRIDELPSTVLPSFDHEIAAMKDGLSVKLSLEQIRELIVESALGGDDNFATSVAASFAALTTALTDPWSFQPIGIPIPLLDNIAGISAPATDKDYRYIKLTAAHAYNTGLLTGESVTGSAPLVVATAVINLAGSPINGRTVNLLNTERRVLRAGLSGTVENDQMQQITGTVDRIASGFEGGPSAAGALAVALTAGTLAIGSARRNFDMTFDSANSPSARAGTETRPKNIGISFYMRIK